MVRRSDTWMTLIAVGLGFLAGGVLILEDSPRFLRYGVMAVGAAVGTYGVYVAITGPGSRPS